MIKTPYWVFIASLYLLTVSVVYHTTTGKKENLFVNANYSDYYYATRTYFSAELILVSFYYWKVLTHSLCWYDFINGSNLLVCLHCYLLHDSFSHSSHSYSISFIFYVSFILSFSLIFLSHLSLFYFLLLEIHVHWQKKKICHKAWEEYSIVILYKSNIFYCLHTCFFTYLL